jgi:hypothetical protein
MDVTTPTGPGGLQWWHALMGLLVSTGALLIMILKGGKDRGQLEERVETHSRTLATQSSHINRLVTSEAGVDRRLVGVEHKVDDLTQSRDKLSGQMDEVFDEISSMKLSMQSGFNEIRQTLGEMNLEIKLLGQTVKSELSRSNRGTIEK